MFLILLPSGIIFHAVVVVIAIDAKGCLRPGQGIHAIAAMSKDGRENEYPVNTSISYNCEPGYEIFNNETRRCLNNGSWSGSEPYCGLNVATKENIETIKLYADGQFFLINYDKVPIEKISTTTWSVKLKKIYTIDMLKLTIEVDSDSEDLNPDVRYSSSHDIQSTNETVNYKRIVSTLVSADCRSTSAEADKMPVRKTAVYHCPIKSPSPSQFVSFQIQWLATNLTLQNISLYTSSGVCASASETFWKRVVYGNKCYDLITTRASWSDSETACRSYPIHGSTLASFSKDDVKMLNYFHSVVNNTELVCIEGFWTTDKNNKSDYRMIRFPNIFLSRDPPLRQNFGRICEYDCPKCGSPDQKKGTLMVSDERTANYSCPNGFHLVGSGVRHCSEGKWTSEAPSCEHDVDPEEALTAFCSSKNEKLIDSILDEVIKLLVGGDEIN